MTKSHRQARARPRRASRAWITSEAGLLECVPTAAQHIF